MCANLLQEPPHLVPHLELPFPGPAEPFPAVISDSGRAEQLPPRKPSRRRPSPSSPPPELSSWSRAVPPCLRASAVPPVAPPGAPHLGEPRPAAFATERSSSMNGRRTRSARLGAHLAALRDSTSAARSQEAASPLHGHHCRRNRPFPVLLCFKSQPRTSDSLAQRICISPSSLDLWVPSLPRYSCFLHLCRRRPAADPRPAAPRPTTPASADPRSHSHRSAAGH